MSAANVTHPKIQRPTGVEAAKQQIKVRFNTDSTVWEVWTHVFGSNLQVWKWFIVNKEDIDWYVNKLHISVIPYVKGE